MGVSGSGQRVHFQCATSIPAPCVGCLADDSAEATGEVRLIAHSTAQCNFAQCVGGCQHQSLGKLDPASRKVQVSRHAKGAFEHPAKMAGAEAEQAGQVLDANFPAQIGINVRNQASRLPTSEASGRGRGPLWPLRRRSRVEMIHDFMVHHSLPYRTVLTPTLTSLTTLTSPSLTPIIHHHSSCSFRSHSSPPHSHVAGQGRAGLDCLQSCSSACVVASNTNGRGPSKARLRTPHHWPHHRPQAPPPGPAGFRKVIAAMPL